MTQAWNSYFLGLFQKELDNFLLTFKEDIARMNNYRTNKRNITDLIKVFSQRIIGAMDIIECRLQDNPKIPREFYWKNSSRFIFHLLEATQTPLGKLVQDFNPQFRDMVNLKMKHFAQPSPNLRMESIPEVENLRKYCERVR